MPKPNTVRLTGELPTTLANAISDAIHAALDRGMEVDEAVCVSLAVCADYGRGHYGDEYLDDMADIITSKRGDPLPYAT